MPQLSLHSPLGDLTISEEEGRIVSVDWGWSPLSAETPLLSRTAEQIHAYFDGELTEFDLPMAPSGTPYQRRVWAAIARIPYGSVASYADIARETDSGPRAVGMACGRNHIPLLIPCHRVLASGGKIGGYSGGDGLETKRALLRLEGYLLS